MIADINLQNATSVGQEAEKLQRKALPVQVDISKEGDVNRMVGETLKYFGKIDILVNNADVGFGSHPGWELIKDLTIENWQNILNINLTGTFLCSKAVLATMMKQRKGAIINISSALGKKGKAKYGAYTSSKFGIEGLSQVLSLELAPYTISGSILLPRGVPQRQR